MLGTRTVEEHDGYREDLKMPGTRIRWHADLKMVHLLIAARNRSTIVTVSVTWGSGKHLHGTSRQALLGLIELTGIQLPPTPTAINKSTVYYI